MAKHQTGTIQEILARHYRKCAEENAPRLDRRKSDNVRWATSKRMKRLWATEREYILGLRPLPKPAKSKPAITQGDYQARLNTIKATKDQYYAEHPEIPYGS